jgi:hypothetical protein
MVKLKEKTSINKKRNKIKISTRMGAEIEK